MNIKELEENLFCESEIISDSIYVPRVEVIVLLYSKKPVLVCSKTVWKISCDKFFEVQDD